MIEINKRLIRSIFPCNSVDSYNWMNSSPGSEYIRLFEINKIVIVLYVKDGL
jgi:hypothetical protein